MRTFKRFLLAAAFVVVAAPVAMGAPITYVHTGSGSGTLDGGAFGAAAPLPFTITATGDTDNLQSCGGGCLSNDNLTASITIQTLGTFDFVTPTRYFFNPNTVGFSRTGSGGLDLFNGPTIAGGWDMVTSVGPVAGSASLLQWGSGDIVTNGGILIFNDGGTSSTFSARVGASTAPEPGTLLLLTIGLAAGLRRYSRASR